MHSFTFRQNLGPFSSGGSSASAGAPSAMYAAKASLCAGSQRESGVSRTTMSPAAHAIRFASISEETSLSGQMM